jgi:hypothetical protein
VKSHLTDDLAAGTSASNLKGMDHRRPRRNEPNLDSGEHWGLDQQEVRRHLRRMRQAQAIGPLGKLLRVVAVVVVLAGAFLVIWNFSTLRQARLDFSALTDLFSRDEAPAGAEVGEEPGTEVVADSSIAGGVSLPTSIKPDEAEPAPVEAPAEAPPAPVQPTPSPSPAEPATPAALEPEPVATVTEDPPPAAPPPPPEPELPARPETFGFGLRVMNVSEASASAAVLVLRDGGRRGESFITWWTTDGAASAGSDFARLEPRVERFGAGEQNRTLYVPIIGDRNVEGAENFHVHIALGDSGQPVAEIAEIEVVITDDD